MRFCACGSLLVWLAALSRSCHSAVGFGILIPTFPNQANSPYGALALIALFSGFFLLMGFLWSVIGE